MEFPPLIPGRFVRRDNRFRVTVLVDGVPAAAHVANSGRLTDLFTPDRPVWLSPAGDPARKTDYDLRLVAHEGVLVSVDARLPNPLLAEALAAGRVAGFDRPVVQREVRHGTSRLDFRLADAAGVCWVETKSVTLVENGVALFPDAPTARGRRHVAELGAIAAAGGRALVVFVVQRPDAAALAPHSSADPGFTAALQAASVRGVILRAYRCRVDLRAISLAEEIPVRLPATLADPDAGSRPLEEER